MIPIGDYAGARPRFPFVNIALIATNILVFLYQLTLPDARLEQFIYRWAAIPTEIVRGTDLPPTIPLPIYATLVTSIFLHGGWLHLGGNMLFLWVFGDNVENAFGSLKYLLFYLVCGVGASLVQIAFNLNSTIPTVGASGAIAGVMGAYLVMFPGATVRTIITLFIIWPVVYLPAVVVIGVWFLMQFLSGLSSLGVQTAQTGGVAVWAHVGGLVIGALLALPLRGTNYHAARPTTFRGY